MNARNLVISAAVAIGLAAGGLVHQAQAIETCTPGSGDICDQFVATAQGQAPDIIPDPTRSMLFSTVNDVRSAPRLVTLPEPLATQERFLMATFNAAIGPYQPLIIGTEYQALRLVNDTTAQTRSLVFGEACTDKHDGKTGGNGHDKDRHCEQLD